MAAVKTVSGSGQLSVFDLIKMFEMVSAEPVAAEGKAGSDVDYLRKGERIATLLKERMESDLREFKARAFLDVLNFKTYSACRNTDEKAVYVLSQIRNRFLRPCVNEMHTAGISPFLELFPGFGNFVEQEAADAYSTDIVKSVFYKERNCIRDVVSLKLKGYTFFVPCGLTGSQIGKVKGCASYRKKSGPFVYVADAAGVFSILAVFAQLRAMVREKFSLLKEEELCRHPLYVFLNQRIADACESRRLDDTGVVYLLSRESQPYVLTYLKEHGIPYHIFGTEEYYGSSRLLRQKFEKRLGFDAILFLQEQLDLSQTNFELGWLRIGWKNCYGYLDCGVSIRFLVNLIDQVFFEYLEDKRDHALAKSLSREYAKSFQTKKNIPKNVLEAMKNSPFNQYFGYVEYDEDTDLAAMEDLYKHFASLAEFIGLKKHDEVSLRFRKLGNHKAAGLYYYVLKCLCVDLRHPSSFAHEMMHMLDYEHGKISRSADFLPTLLLYRQAFEREVQKDSAVSGKMDGTGKYNRQYYLQSTEVFARCGEIYLTRICGVDNSVVQPDEKESGYAYPKDELLEESIGKFFDQFLHIDRTLARAV